MFINVIKLVQKQHCKIHFLIDSYVTGISSLDCDLLQEAVSKIDCISIETNTT